jgi:hypothetical protein
VVATSTEERESGKWHSRERVRAATTSTEKILSSRWRSRESVEWERVEEEENDKSQSLEEGVA